MPKLETLKMYRSTQLARPFVARFHSAALRMNEYPAGKSGKPLSSFFAFCNEQRDKIKAEFPDMSTKDLQSKLGEKWRDLSEQEKQKYKDAYSDAASKFKEASDSASAAASEAKDKAGNMANELKDKATEAKNSFEKKAEEFKDEVKSKF